jgi:prepilin-type N-terminal cleavage/methylation domain-containing protein
MRAARTHTSAGMTLIEVMVALAIIALLLALLPAMFSRVRKADLRADAGKLAAAMRSAYDRAGATAAHHRLVIDLEADKFWIERCEGKVQVVRDVDEAKAEAQQAIIARMSKPPDVAPSIPGMAAPPTDLLAGLTPPPDLTASVGSGEASVPCSPTTGAGTGELSRSVGVQFRQVMVSHLEKPAEDGKVSINFFPLGRAERAVIVLDEKDDKDAVYSVRLHALSGRVEVIAGEIRDAREIVEGRDVTQ